MTHNLPLFPVLLALVFQLNVSGQEVSTAVPVFRLIESVHDRFGVYFAVEQAAPAPGEVALLFRRISIESLESADAETVRADLEILLDCQIDGANHRGAIWSLQERGLKSSPLDNTLPTVQYSGLLSGLIGHLGKEIPAIQYRVGFIAGSQFARNIDRGTEIYVARSKPIAVRDLFSMAVPTEDHSPLLWHATTTKDCTNCTVVFTGTRDDAGRKDTTQEGMPSP